MPFENKIFEGIHYSRFIISWVKSGGKVTHIRSWLRQLTINGKTIPEDVIDEIYDIATNGKMELESNAAKFLEAKLDSRY